MQFLHQMFNVSALLLDDALKPAKDGANAVVAAMTAHCRSIQAFSSST